MSTKQQKRKRDGDSDAESGDEESKNHKRTKTMTKEGEPEKEKEKEEEEKGEQEKEKEEEESEKPSSPQRDASSDDRKEPVEEEEKKEKVIVDLSVDKEEDDEKDDASKDKEKKEEEEESSEDEEEEAKNSFTEPFEDFFKTDQAAEKLECNRYELRHALYCVKAKIPVLQKYVKLIPAHYETLMKMYPWTCSTKEADHNSAILLHIKERADEILSKPEDQLDLFRVLKHHLAIHPPEIEPAEVEDAHPGQLETPLDDADIEHIFKSLLPNDIHTDASHTDAEAEDDD